MSNTEAQLTSDLRATAQRLTLLLVEAERADFQRAADLQFWATVQRHLRGIEQACDKRAPQAPAVESAAS